jgi:hypothetical protein
MEDKGDYCLVSGDEETYATCYGGVLDVVVTTSETRVRLSGVAAEQLGLPPEIVITHARDSVDVAQLEQQIHRVLHPS